MAEMDIEINTEFKILLPASQIPDRSTVTKRTGEKPYILRHNLKVYPVEVKGESSEPMTIDGFFLCDTSGSFYQIKPDTVLCWTVEAKDLMCRIERALEGTPQ